MCVCVCVCVCVCLYMQAYRSLCNICSLTLLSDGPRHSQAI